MRLISLESTCHAKGVAFFFTLAKRAKSFGLYLRGGLMLCKYFFILASSFSPSPLSSSSPRAAPLARHVYGLAQHFGHR